MEEVALRVVAVQQKAEQEAALAAADVEATRQAEVAKAAQEVAAAKARQEELMELREREQKARELVLMAEEQLARRLEAEHEETVVQAPDSACTAAEPHPPPTPPHIRVQETVGTLQSQLLDVFDEENLVRIMHQLQTAQSIVVQQICNANRQNRGDVFQEASARTRGQALMKFKGRGQG